MSFSTEKREVIKRYLLEKIRMDDEQYITKTAENFQISVTSVKRYISDCLKEEILVPCKEQKTGYRLSTKTHDFAYSLANPEYEDKIYYTDILPLLTDISPEARHIWSYSFTEMMNNAIEHANAGRIFCHVKQDFLYTEISITDDGIGIFKNMQDFVAKETGQRIDYHDAILELHKGKFTTNPATHSGEGIFFTSKMLNAFAIWSDNSAFFIGCTEREIFTRSHLIAYYTKLNHIGTMLIMKLKNRTTRTPKEIFDMYAPMDEGFFKTYIPLKEVCPYGEPIARSQARRIVHRLEQFQKVELDFADIEFMGQGFADEIFRVFQNQYPKIELIPLHANETILGMIKHVKAFMPAE